MSGSTPKGVGPSKQIIKTARASAKAAKTLTKVFRDAFGRFSKQPSPKTSHQKSQPKIQKEVSKKSKSSPTSPSKSKSSKRPAQTPSKSLPKAKRTTKAATRNSGKVSTRKIPPVTKPTPIAPKKQGKSYTLKNLNRKRAETTIQFLDRIEENQDEIDALKGKDDFWVFTYAKGKSRRVYRNIGLAIQRMRGYQLTKQIEDEDEGSEIDHDLLESIKFTQFHGTPLEYVVPNEERIKLRAAERQRIRREAKQLLGGKPEPDFGGNIDLVKQLTEQLRIEREKNANISKRVPKTGTASKPATAKKPATKSAGKKKSIQKTKQNRATSKTALSKPTNSVSKKTSKGKGKRK